MNKQEARKLLHTHLKTESLRNHCLAVAVIMEALAIELKEDTTQWFITGLLHDIDLDIIGEQIALHGIKAMDLLDNTDLSASQRNAIKSHTGKFERSSILDKALWCADPLSGLITAATYTHPSKKISTLPIKSLKKRMKDKRFAASVSRTQISACSDLGITLETFLEIAKKAMANVEEELGF